MSYRKDIAQAWAHVHSIPSRELETVFGTVEYAVQGDGPPVLMSHGILGCHTEGVGMVRAYVGVKSRAIAPSRFGYFGSTMPPDATPAIQADVYASLLDHLEIDRALVVGYSAGGPSAIEFALRYPERVRALALTASALPPSVKQPGFMRPVLSTITRTDLVFWMFKAFMPDKLRGLMGVPKDYVAPLNEEVTIREVGESILPIVPRRVGFVFDAFVGNIYSRQIPLEDVAVPTIIVHSADDALAPYAHAVNAADRIPGAQFVTMPKGGHLFLGHEADVSCAIQEFLWRRCTDAHGQPGRLSHANPVLLPHEERTGSREQNRTTSHRLLATTLPR
jgi:2-hydroxy-6-oxonona-2,4-dienedioate hydrolase